MRTVLIRGALAVATVAASVMPTSSATAARSTDCDSERSKKVFTGGLFGNETDHLWVDVLGKRVMVCFQLESLAIGGLTIVADAASGVVPPDVDIDDNDALCPTTIATANDPIPVRLKIGLPETSAVCLTVGTSTLSVSFTEGSVSPGDLPVLEIWRDGSTSANRGLIDALFCPVEWVNSLFGGPTTCMDSNARVFP